MRQRGHPILDELHRAAGAADDDGPAARHAFGDDQPERFRLSARVHDDVERAQHGGRALDESREANAIR